jgi:hypothetical protein
MAKKKTKKTKRRKFDYKKDIPAKPSVVERTMLEIEHKMNLAKHMFRLVNQVPYGFKEDPDNSYKYIFDEEQMENLYFIIDMINNGFEKADVRKEMSKRAGKRWAWRHILSSLTSYHFMAHKLDDIPECILKERANLLDSDATFYNYFRFAEWRD